MATTKKFNIKNYLADYKLKREGDCYNRKTKIEFKVLNFFLYFYF